MDQRKVDLVQQFLSSLQPRLSAPGSRGRIDVRPLSAPPQALSVKEAIDMPESFPQFAWHTAGGYGPTAKEGAWHAMGYAYDPHEFQLRLAAGCARVGEMNPHALWKMHHRTSGLSPQAFPSLVLVTQSDLKPVLLSSVKQFSQTEKCFIVWHLFPLGANETREVVEIELF